MRPSGTSARRTDLYGHSCEMAAGRAADTIKASVGELLESRSARRCLMAISKDDILKLTVSERLALIETIWESISDAPSEIPLTEA